MYDFYFSKTEFNYQKKEFKKGSKVHVHRCFFKGKEYTRAESHGTPFDGFPIDTKLIGTGDITGVTTKPY
jgi:hypothetical protein